MDTFSLYFDLNYRPITSHSPLENSKEDEICFAILMWHARRVAYSLKSSFSSRKFHFVNVQRTSPEKL